jgi:hypothetical protein
MKHVETKQLKQVTINAITNKIIKKGVVNLHDMYTEDLHDIWKTKAYFVQDFIKMAPPTVNVTAQKKVGTVAYKRGYDFKVLETPQKAKPVQLLTMGGLFPKQYVGSIANINVSNLALINKNKYPKMFQPLANSTKELYRTIIDNETVYCQVATDGNQYIFRHVTS